MESYIESQELLEYVKANATLPHELDVAAVKKWKTKVAKALLAIKTTIEEEMINHIRDASTPKEAWDILAMKFFKKNDSCL
jgi:hypothetical protein